jgi:hypothetical protein
MKMKNTAKVVGAVFATLSLSLGHLSEAQDSSDPQRDERTRFRLMVNGGFNPTTTSFSDLSTFTAFLEQGSSQRNYETSTGAVFEVGGIVSITRSLGVMAAVEVFQGESNGSFRYTEPHPLLFNRDRSVEGDVAGLSYTERAIHVDFVLTQDLGATILDVFAGPTFFSTETEVIGDITTTSPYPFDDLTFSGTSAVTLSDNPVGFNAGAALTLRLSRVVGVAFQARFSRASVGVQRSGGELIELDAGGFRAGAGIRLAF